jgi:hypothetical protein
MQNAFRELLEANATRHHAPRRLLARRSLPQVRSQGQLLGKPAKSGTIVATINPVAEEAFDRADIFRAVQPRVRS